MKRILSLFILIILLLIVACGGTNSSTASMLIVIEKGYSSDNEEYWIRTYDPNNETKDEASKIIVNEVMVWNLIVEDKEYFATYGKEGNNPLTIYAIEYPDKTIKKRELK